MQENENGRRAETIDSILAEGLNRVALLGYVEKHPSEAVKAFSHFRDALSEAHFDAYEGLAEYEETGSGGHLEKPYKRYLGPDSLEKSSSEMEEYLRKFVYADGDEEILRTFADELGLDYDETLARVELLKQDPKSVDANEPEVAPELHR